MKVALVAVLFLAGCTASDVGRAVDPMRDRAVFVPDAGGLGVAGSTQRVDFGRSPKGVIPVMQREMGGEKVLPLTGCPAGVMQQVAYGDLVLTFTRERFVGWKLADTGAGEICA